MIRLILRVQPAKLGMQRPRRNSLPRGSYSEIDEDDDVVFPEIIQDESDDDTEDYSSASDDEFVPYEPIVEVDRCEIYCMFLQYFFLFVVITL